MQIFVLAASAGTAQILLLTALGVTLINNLVYLHSVIIFKCHCFVIVLVTNGPGALLTSTPDKADDSSASLLTLLYQCK